MASVYETALAYLNAGLGVLPVRRDGTKAPAVPRGHPYLKQRPGEADLRRWFARPDPLGIGVPGGAVSGGAECIDFDLESQTLFPLWGGLVEESAPGLLKRLTVIETPRDPPGYHVWYRCPAAGEVQKLARLSDEEKEVEKAAAKAEGRKSHFTLIETRGEGSYAVAPGSPLECHETHRPYTHVSGPALTQLTVISADERELLLACARSLSREVVHGPTPSAGAVGDAKPGQDFERQATWADVLLPLGWAEAGRKGDEIRWRRPGKPDGWSATTGVCKGKDGADLLRVFTENAPPLEARAYRKFAVYALCAHGADFGKAAKELAGMGFGAPARPRPRVDAALNGNGTSHHGANGHAGPRPEVPPEPSFDAEPTPWPAPPGEVAYSGLAGEIVRKIAPQTEADPAAILVQLLVMFGNAINRKAHWKVESDYHYGNLFCCLVGETGKGRKGTSKGRALQAFGELPASDDWAKMRITSGLSSGEGLIYAVRDPAYELHHVKQKGRVTDTQNVLKDPGVRDKRLLVVEPEFGRVLRVMEREGNTLSARLRESWDTGNLSNMTKGGMRATGAHISIIGHVTRCELSKLLSDVDAANGLANRFLWVAVRRSKLLPLGGDPVDLSGRARLVADAVGHGQKADEVPFDAEARSLWCDDLYARLTKGGPGLLGAITNRAEAQVRRLALLYALLDFKEAVGLTHLLAAVALWEFSERSARWAFGESTGDRLADEVLDGLLASGERGLSATEISGLFGRNVPARRLKEAVAVLLDAGNARAEKVATGRPGRPEQRFYAHEINARTNQTTGEAATP